MLNIEKLSTSYQVKKLSASDAGHVFDLVQTNPLYFAYCPPQPTRHSIVEDMNVVPANKSLDDKYYLGFYQADKLIAVMDLVTGYPDKNTVWLGFFMVGTKYQGKGIGTTIMTEVIAALKDFGMQRIELSPAKGNAQSEHFLLKNGFVKIGREIQVPGYTVVLMAQDIHN